MGSTSGTIRAPSQSDMGKYNQIALNQQPNTIDIRQKPIQRSDANIISLVLRTMANLTRICIYITLLCPTTDLKMKGLCLS